MDKPMCTDCGIKTESNGLTQPTARERKWEAGRVEAYKCPKCGRKERFPRYNHPGKLLKTRCGRCGEFANCKALILRAMGFEVRHVTDWTDHVWVEVFSDSQQRWIHCDGGKCDENFLYERWWKKKLTYIIAFSKDEVHCTLVFNSVHTLFFSSKYLLVIKSLEFGEMVSIFSHPFEYDARRRSLPPERTKVLVERSMREQAELLSVYEGRLLGTASWRRMIGHPESVHEPFIFTPTEEELRAKRFVLSYCCASDKYFRGSDAEPTLEGWKSGASAIKSMFRKTEHDWTPVMTYLIQKGIEEDHLVSLQKGNAYLARFQCCPSGLVSWQVDFTSSDVVIDSVTIKALATTTQTGQVEWTLQGENQTTEKLDFVNAQESVTTTVIRGSKTAKLTATLSGGNGDAAWQQAQLFSQPINDNDSSLEITITLQDVK
ncbi:PREDICTED: peptide-N(4)-(N-acetyl-beta-glucosaminyl)asparagine amidase-like [Acropora digitifera]|uniref:peptide-N(4)-(N-acetyl-beta- glucosaminyl)asparagine amidase-like n=1 Tax=Acropora digitifera TaxID=70779 RepID=UPI00077A6D00|nr:PREDICTED: peptide-N(4)-(N-acetyl-beta-glucosaminyl)asparagine amidase-like [Acropora digitifera]